MAPEAGTPLLHLPLVPVHVLQRHRVYIPLDTRFRSAARLLQALWREEQKLPIGSYVAEDNQRHKLGSRIALKAGNAGGNCLSEKIFLVARREFMYREIGAMIDPERLACNLLSRRLWSSICLRLWRRNSCTLLVPLMNFSRLPLLTRAGCCLNIARAGVTSNS